MANVTKTITGGSAFYGNADTATTANTASYINASNVIGTVTSASYALSASYAPDITSYTSSLFGTASWATTAVTANALNIANSYTVTNLTASGNILIGPATDASAALYISHSATLKAIEVDMAGGIETFELGATGTASFAYLSCSLYGKVIPQIFSTASSVPAIAPNILLTEYFDATAIAAPLTMSNPSVSASNFQKLMVRIKDNGAARGLQWGTQYQPGILSALPTTTVVSKWMNLGFIYNTTGSGFFQLAAFAQEV